MESYHVPVMPDEVSDALQVHKDGIYLDCTLGGGGHAERILAAGGRLIAVDRDDEAIAYATDRLKRGGFDGRFTVVKSDFKAAGEVLDGLGVDKIDGAVMDLGISSHQVDDPSRGFSYRYDSPLDMRMDRTETLTARTVVNEYSEDDLARILFAYGEEPFAKKIARAIVKARAETPIETTGSLAELVQRSVPFRKKGHPAKQTFQAIRIEVNGELSGLETAIEKVVERLNPGARLAVITFHSLEDRVVKQTFRTLSTGCICDKSLPVCVCGHVAVVKTVGKKRAGEIELQQNPRAASATLRIIEKL